MASRSRSGAELLVDVLVDEGVRHVFGNPGTTELPLVDALAGRRELSYVLALQEASAVGMADGYARATGRPSFVNLHTVAGLANGLGNLTNAAAARTPMVVSAGQQDSRHLIAEPLLSGDLVGLARPLVKWAHEVRSLGELGVATRRAFRLAAAHPPGPVFLGLPMDVLADTASLPLPARSHVDDLARADSLGEIASRLVAAKRPALVVGDELARGNGLDDAVALAGTLGSPVFGSPLHTRAAFPTSHPLWRGALPTSATGIADALRSFDRVLLLGAHAFLVNPYTDASAIPEGLEVLQIHPDPSVIGRTYAVSLGVVGDPAAAARELADLLRPHIPEARRSQALEAGRTARETAFARLTEQIERGRATKPISAAAAVAAVYSRLPEDVVVVDEAVTAGVFTRAMHRGSDPLSFLWSGAGALGWGLSAAIGVKLAQPGRVVVAICGDGTTLYAPQALWSAARYRIPIVAVVLDNHEYRILKEGLDRLRAASAHTGEYVGMDITNPQVDFVALAEAFGVAARSVSGAEDLADAVEEAIKAKEPRLIRVPVADHVRQGT